MEPYIKIPLWIELSGLPMAMNEAARTPAAWGIFSRIVALDCQRNPTTSAPVGISLDDLAALCGIVPGAIRKAVPSMRKKGWLAFFLPDNDEEEALFQVKVPLPTPIPVDQVKQNHPALFSECTKPLRYEAEAASGDTEEEAADDRMLQEVIDLYFNTISMKMNNFILDELRLVRQRFEMELIRKIFYRAKGREITSMGWILKELHRETAKKLKQQMGEETEDEDDEES